VNTKSVGEVLLKNANFTKNILRLNKGVSFWAKTLCWEKYIFLNKDKFMRKYKMSKLYSL